VLAAQLAMYSESALAGSEPVFLIVSFDVEYSVDAGVLLEIGNQVEADVTSASQLVLTFTAPFCERQAVPALTVLLNVSVPLERLVFEFESLLVRSA
jgi:hypothetical protein